MGPVSMNWAQPEPGQVGAPDPNLMTAILLFLFIIPEVQRGDKQRLSLFFKNKFAEQFCLYLRASKSRLRDELSAYSISLFKMITMMFCKDEKGLWKWVVCFFSWRIDNKVLSLYQRPQHHRGYKKRKHGKILLYLQSWFLSK